ncbi:DHS-like NAD/FAD-binding domain-containing protein [Catenaria anguillulae PL171]|uniref:DHS-like NAD/FAD-binding domain-containing protein n=1 Tax=Catenaria anguillulae PL171 TaxID=765915 RepID=A0A1Y2HEW2_9FUNG|nr:DHS-like NAD/FAD-binding domain-containing protein [Catenaria anguillulae PL171]
MAFEQQVVATAAAIHAAKRVVIVTGAGISVSAGIPDFRSESGLYNLIKLQNPGTVVKGQDLFDASLFRTEPTRRLFYSFMAGLRDACTQAQPTPVHAMMRELDKRGKLLRCYTQNIDGLEERAAQNGSPNRTVAAATSPAAKHPPTVIQLHGTLTHVRCVLCSTRLPFTSTLSTIFAQGDPPACPACMHDADMRAAANKRARATGTLRPDVVLYNEPNPNGDAIADVLGKDLRRRPDVVLVMGTSLKVHGIKRLVRDLAAAARGARARQVAEA